MKIGISKKIVIPYGIGLSIFLFIIAFSYINLSSLSSLLNKNTEIADRVKLISDLQVIIQKLVMPANDYLITGDKKERDTFAQLNTELTSIFANIKLSKNKTEEEKAIEKKARKGINELQMKALVLLATENPINNREAAKLMEEMDAFADGLTNLVENFHIIAKEELKLHSMKASQINKRIFKIYIILLSISLTGVIVITFLITSGVVRPLQKLTKAVRTIGQGNLDYHIEIKTGDEIEMLGEEFNNMTQALKIKNNEIKKYTERLEKTNRQLDQNILQLYTLYNISKTITATFEIEKLLNQITREEVIGIINVYKLNGEYIDETSYELLVAAANQIGMTLENARLFEDSKDTRNYRRHDRSL